MEFYENDVYVEQHPCETTFEYYERFLWTLENHPYHGLLEHELIMDFLDGMLPMERYILDDMAGGSIYDCCLRDAWDLIEERVEDTRPYMESNSEQHIEEMIRNLAQQILLNAEKTNKALEDLREKILCLEKSKNELPSPRIHVESQPTQCFLEDTKVVASDKKDEDVKNRTLQVVHTTSNADNGVEQENLISSKFLIEMDTQDKNCNFKEVLDEDKVRGSLYENDIQLFQTKEFPKFSNCARSFDELCMNWKSRKKVKHVKKAISTLFSTIQQIYFKFGWKPGWESKENTYGVMKKHHRWRPKKFDGALPWDPNI